MHRQVDVHEEKFGNNGEEQSRDPFGHWLEVVLAMVVEIQRSNGHGRGDTYNDDRREIVHT